MILEILKYPDERLRTVAEPINEIDDNVRQKIADMFVTMYHHDGIGLAATQVDYHKQLIVMDIEGNALVLINPEIVSTDGARKEKEGCLSVPGCFDFVERAAQVRIKALNELGNEFTMDADGLLGACIQHEIDHLNGKVFVDHLSEMKRLRIRKKLKK